MTGEQDLAVQVRVLHRQFEALSRDAVNAEAALRNLSARVAKLESGEP